MNSTTGSRSFAERIGGRWALSVPGFAICFGVGGVGLMINVVTLGGGRLVIALVAYLTVLTLAALCALILDRTRWSNRREVPIPIFEVTIFSVVVGLMVAATFALARRWWGVDTGYGSTEGFVIYPIVGVWMGFTSVLYLDIIDRARHLRQNVVAAHATVDRIRDKARLAVEEMRVLIDGIVSPAVESLRSVTGHEPPSKVSAEIRGVVDESVRPVSHDLWERFAEPVARIGWTDLARDVFARPRFRTWPIIGLVIVLPFIDQVNRDGLIIAVPYALAGVLLYVECATANRLLLRWRQWRLLIVLATLTVFVTQNMLAEQFSRSQGWVTADLGWVTVTIFTLILVVVTSILGSYRDLDDRRAMALAADIRADRLDAMAQARVVSEETRRLAGLLHGRVQSRLLGCAMAIEFAGDDPDALQAALDRTSAVLAEDWYVIETSGDENPSTPILDALATWVGVARVDVRGNPAVAASADPDLVTVVEELVANAVRHGGARQVEVNLEQDGADWVVTVVDDGSSSGAVRPGLGTVIISRAGSIERDPDPDGWAVTVRLTDRAHVGRPTPTI